MFTGIVTALGEVVDIEHHAGAATLTVRGASLAREAHGGDSVAVNGVCLTVTSADSTCFTADVMAETLARSTLGALASGDQVNLEAPLRLADRLGGHLVQGHTDGVGTIVSRDPGPHWDVLRVTLPPGLSRYVVEKGSVAVHGVSLTVSAVSSDTEHPWFEVSLIPATLAATTLGRAQPGERVNLEVDVIGKYVERMLRDTAVRP